VPYEFVDVDRLIDDFIREVEAWQSGHWRSPWKKVPGSNKRALAAAPTADQPA